MGARHLLPSLTMKTSMIVLAAALACYTHAAPTLEVKFNATASGVCDLISGDLPSECTCTDKALGGLLNCTVSMLDLDEIGVDIDVEPCAQPDAFIDMKVTEADLGIDYDLGQLK